MRQCSRYLDWVTLAMHGGWKFFTHGCFLLKRSSYSFLFVFDFSTQQKERDLAFENKPLERSHRQLSTSLGLLFHPESYKFIFFSFVSNMILGSLKVKTLRSCEIETEWIANQYSKLRPGMFWIMLSPNI